MNRPHHRSFSLLLGLALSAVLALPALAVTPSHVFDGAALSAPTPSADCTDKPVTQIDALDALIQGHVERGTLSASQGDALRFALRSARQSIFDCDLGRATDWMIRFNRLIEQLYGMGVLTRDEAGRIANEATHVIALLGECDCTAGASAGSLEEPVLRTHSASDDCDDKPVDLLDDLRALVDAYEARGIIGSADADVLRGYLRQARQGLFDCNRQVVTKSLVYYNRTIDALYQAGTLTRTQAGELTAASSQVLVLIRSCTC
ncbi:MAG: hypothetical protein AAF533_26700 [Acidobacteriota bacterium]